MTFKTQKEAIEYLKSLDSIVVPSQFTYFNHCTCYQNSKIQTEMKSRGTWTGLPLNNVVLTQEMSFVERNRRIIEALEYGSVERANISYHSTPLSKNFILRVIMPKQNLSLQDKENLGITEEYQEKLRSEYRGFGDGRHPKLGKGEKILIFACSTVDEISKKNIDIFYGVREQDVIMYANKVANELQKQNEFPECILPTATQSPGNSYYLFDRNLDNFDKDTYSIKKSKDFSRYKERWILGTSGPIQIKDSEFEVEYQEEIKRELNDILQKKVKKLEDLVGVQLSNYFRSETITECGVRVNLVPKTFKKLQMEQEELKYMIDYLYNSGKISENYKNGLISDLNYVYEKWKLVALQNQKDYDTLENTPPQTTHFIEHVRRNTEISETEEIKKSR